MRSAEAKKHEYETDGVARRRYNRLRNQMYAGGVDPSTIKRFEDTQQSDFIRSQPKKSTAPEVVEKAKTFGLSVNKSFVYQVRAEKNQELRRA